MTLPVPPDLPVLPAPRARAIVLLMNPDAPLDGFVSIVEGDPALTASVLRAANSAASWPVQPVHSAREGVIRLGSASVRQIVAAAVMRAEFERMDGSGVDTDELWRHVLGCALLCEVTGDDEEMQQQAFTVGLLHDLGRLAMAAQAPTRYSVVVNGAQDGEDAQALERRMFGVDHAEFGARICRRWRLPENVVQVIGAHHETEPTGALGTALGTARRIIAGLGVGDGIHRPDRRDPEMESHPLLQKLGGREGLLTEIRWFREATVGRRGPVPGEQRRRAS